MSWTPIDKCTDSDILEWCKGASTLINLSNETRNPNQMIQRGQLGTTQYVGMCLLALIEKKKRGL